MTTVVTVSRNLNIVRFHSTWFSKNQFQEFYITIFTVGIFLKRDNYGGYRKDRNLAEIQYETPLEETALAK